MTLLLSPLRGLAGGVPAGPDRGEARAGGLGWCHVLRLKDDKHTDNSSGILCGFNI